MRVPIRVVACAIVLAGCREKTQEQSAGDVARAPATAAMPVTQASWAPDALDELVAPIALYPDQLVGQILAASVNARAPNQPMSSTAIICSFVSGPSAADSLSPWKL